MAVIFRDPVYDGAADPTVIRRVSDGRYFMFYTQRRATLECSGVEWAHGTRIGVAVCDGMPFGDGEGNDPSVSNGAALPDSSPCAGEPGRSMIAPAKTGCAGGGDTSSVTADAVTPSPQGEGFRTCDARPCGTGCDGGWRYIGTAELPFVEGKTTYWAPEVIFDGESYRIFVSSVDGVYADWAGSAEILQFVSPDLEKWTPCGAVPIDSARVIDACAFPLPSGGWRLWYKDEKRGSHTFYIDTSDFREWRPGGEATSDTDQEGPNVFAFGGRYRLIADVWKGQAVYVSDDLTRFERQEGTLLPGEAYHADVFVEGGRAWMVYFTYPEGDRRSAVCVRELKEENGELTLA